jgi:hypothetical protein
VTGAEPGPSSQPERTEQAPEHESLERGGRERQGSAGGETAGPTGAAPDPLKGFRGPVSAALVIEIIVVLLTLLVVGKFGGQNGGALGVAVVLSLAAVLAVLVRFAGRPWVPPVAAGLQLVVIACGVLVFSLAVLGVIFGLVWLALLAMRRDIARRMGSGELPGQRG